MKGICINADASTELKQQQEYFLFPAKPNHYYVSRFSHKRSNFGCYQAERFQVIEEEEWPKEPEMDIPQLDKEKYYRADLFWRARGYQNKELKGYVIRPSSTHCYFWHDAERTSLGGCFPIHWFSGFVEFGAESVAEKEPEIELFERDGGQLSFF